MIKSIIRQHTRFSEGIAVEHEPDAFPEDTSVFISYGHDGINGSIAMDRATARRLGQTLIAISEGKL